MIMHKGQRIIEGPPRDLLANNIEKYVLELLDAGALQEKFQESMKGQVRVDHSRQGTRLFSNNYDYLKMLAGSMESGNYYLRQTNLEDVFLKATGRGLNEMQ
jgi:lipooligosaccharide transport system ATP-binding protein